MLKDLLEKFDKEFYELSQEYIPYEGANEIRTLAHSHIEAAYRVGMNIWLSVQDLYQEGFKVGKQSNLEMLIEKCGDELDTMFHKGTDWHVGLYDGYQGDWVGKLGEPSVGSTPTEAVENLIKALGEEK